MSDVWRLGGEVYSTASDENNLRDGPDDRSRELAAMGGRPRSGRRVRLRRAAFRLVVIAPVLGLLGLPRTRITSDAHASPPGAGNPGPARPR